MIQIEVVCPNGFNDMRILKEGVPQDGKVIVSEDTYRQMKQSNPHVMMVERKLKLNPGAKKRMKQEEKDGKSET